MISLFFPLCLHVQSCPKQGSSESRARYIPHLFLLSMESKGTGDDTYPTVLRNASSISFDTYHNMWTGD